MLWLALALSDLKVLSKQQLRQLRRELRSSQEGGGDDEDDEDEDDGPEAIDFTAVDLADDAKRRYVMCGEGGLPDCGRPPDCRTRVSWVVRDLRVSEEWSGMGEAKEGNCPQCIALWIETDATRPRKWRGGTGGGGGGDTAVRLLSGAEQS